MTLCRRTTGLLLLAALSAVANGAAAQSRTSTGEVRQLVTFLWQPGKAEDAEALYRTQLVSIYAATPALRRFRAWREAESPEPLDLMVVSSYAGMAGMDSANAQIRARSGAGPSVPAIYGMLSSMSQHHTDQFIEMLPAVSDAQTDAGELTVFEFLRIVPGGQTRFSTLLATAVRPWERMAGLTLWSETGRTLVSDGWDFVRIYGISALGDWHTYRTRMRESSAGSALEPLIAARKTMILRRARQLSVH